MIIKKTSCIIALLIVLILPNVSAHEPVDPGVTPDSFLWGIDKALDNLNLLLTLNPTNKAMKGITIARERLEEIKVMTEENKIDKAEKAKNEHIKLLSKVKQSISEIEEENSTMQIEQEIEIEREIEEHEEEVEELSTNLKIKIEVKGNLSEEQKALIESILSALENKTGEVKIEIKNKKESTKIKIKIETGKSDEEIEEEIEGIEEEKGLSDIKKEKAIEEIEDTKEDLEELEKELQERKAEGNVTNETSITTLIDNAKEKISKAEEALQNNDFGEAFGQANAAKQLIENAERVLENTVKKFEDEEKREIEVEIKDNKAKIEIEIRGVKSEFILETIDKNAIIEEIAERTSLSVEEVTKLAKFEEEKEDNITIKNNETEIEEINEEDKKSRGRNSGED